MIHIVDNFYPHVDEVLDIAESSCHLSGCGPGLKSVDLRNISSPLYHWFSEQIYDMFRISKTGVFMNTHFTKHTYDGRSKGLIHIDGRNPNSCQISQEQYKVVLCGQIFITKCNDPESGITFFDFAKDCQWDTDQRFHMSLNGCYEVKKENIKEYNKNFTEDVSVKNKQNRLVVWTGGTLHRFSITELQQTRIVQNFYILKN